jgi:hypothetical protein
MLNVLLIVHCRKSVQWNKFSLLRINGFYMFRVLLAHPQEVLDKRHLVYYVRVKSVGCTRIKVEIHFNLARHSSYR